MYEPILEYLYTYIIFILEYIIRNTHAVLWKIKHFLGFEIS